MKELSRERPKDIGKACRLLTISRSTLHYQSVRDDSTVIHLLKQLSETVENEGFWKLYDRIRLKGRKVNHKRVSYLQAARIKNKTQMQKKATYTHKGEIGSTIEFYPHLEY